MTIAAFVQAHDRVILSRLRGAHAKIVTPEYLEPQRLKLACASHDYPSGVCSSTNIRTYAIGDRVYSAEIKTGKSIFAMTAKLKLSLWKHHQKSFSQSIAIARALDLEWTAIDWRKLAMVATIFLEANPSPMFIYFENQTGYPITRELMRLLTRTIENEKI